MRVAVDATSLPAQRVGVAHYLLHLLEAVDGLSDEQDLDLVVVAKPSDAVELGRTLRSARVVEAPGAQRLGRPGRLAWEQTGLAALLRRLRVDAVHCPHYSMPAASPVPAVVVLHDATFWTMPEAHQRSKVLWFRAMTSISRRRAAALITVSDASRTDLSRAAGVPAARVRVVRHGVDSDWFEPMDTGRSDDARERLGIGDGPFVLSVGTIEPRKNLPRLIRAFDSLRDEIDDVRLVLAGRPGWHRDETERAIERARHRGDIRTPGYLSDSDKRALVGAAAVFAYPSLSEGFGIPVVEAMAAGVPVVTSEVSATAEVAGDAALTVDPTDEKAIADALRMALDDPATRSRLASDGPRRARQFTWEAAAKATLDVWREVAGS